ncbi:hypothetical protein [Spongiactinospora sp. TRM90649]|uniref:hypothetical protein n=1 Tax=Spongiactinospora sp. TRM90649 TaxID=3031114 RepID=UPI0023F99C33|nr:hypothetical protein [Spongiactinospora sp. TRM90649]MDF5757204.1 hypothetical protein [Spongiactinospora sp. TRM90649]
MPNLGPVELLIIIVVFGFIAAVTVALVLLAVRLAGGRKPPPREPDLAARARALKSSGHPDRAIMLVRGETGMSYDDASQFVHGL